MKKFNSFSSFMVVTVAALSLAGCSGGEKKAEEAAMTETGAPADTATPAETPAVPAEATPVAYASLTGDPVAGEKIFGQCKACHQLVEGKNGVGPSLHGIIGRTAGQTVGFNYSAANKSSGVVWKEEAMFEYLEAPQKFMKGTKMAFAGLKKPQDRADVIAYLKTKS
ncbi:MAG: cytochrome c family protein [Pseudomonadota bacterium]